MKWILLAVFSLLVVGCPWNPDRDNPMDPNRQDFVKPPPENRSPTVDSVWATTDCQNTESGSICTLVLHAHVNDSDQNIHPGDVSAYIRRPEQEREFLGLMNYDIIRNEYNLYEPCQDFPEGNCYDLQFANLIVEAVDDSGASAQGMATFGGPADTWPRLVLPENNSEVDTQHPYLLWELWSGVGNHTFTVAMRLLNIELSWDTTGLAWNDTSVVVTKELEDQSLNPDRKYYWTVTVTDASGNNITSKPGIFRIVLPPGYPDNPYQKPKTLLTE